MIKGSVLSDLHLEFCTLKNLPGGDILILSGDTWVVGPMRPNANDADSRALKKSYKKFCAEELSKYEIVFVVMGNHDHYGCLFEETANTLRAFLKEFCPNAVLLDNEYYDFEGVRFIGSTFWSTYGNGTAAHVTIQTKMNDFHRIKTKKSLTEYPLPSDGRKIIVPDIYEQHFISQTFLDDALRTAELPCVVITHHAPSLLCLPRFNDIFNDAYASNQHNLIYRYKPAMWTHGHTHYSKRLNVDGTLVVSNQRGYYGHEKCAWHFDPTAADFTLEDVKERKLFTN
jgi:Icc-related predicted phosphoesterase